MAVCSPLMAVVVLFPVWRATFTMICMAVDRRRSACQGSGVKPSRSSANMDASSACARSVPRSRLAPSRGMRGYRCCRSLDQARHAALHVVCGTLTGAPEDIGYRTRRLGEGPQCRQEVATEPDVIGR